MAMVMVMVMMMVMVMVMLTGPRSPTRISKGERASEALFCETTTTYKN